MSFSNVMSWWEEWQLRILVLGSLAIQLFLAAFSPLRKLAGLGYLHRLTIWVSYVGGDALAIYALATLFNRQKKLQYSSSSSVKNDGSHDLEVLWAPILLMHLGGRLTMSAYNIEDNELWLRHVGVAVSQVTVTVYVFWTSWSPTADKRLFAAAIVLLILGILRCFEKPIALKRASFNNLANCFIPAPRTEIGNSREVDLEQYIQEARGLYPVRRHQQEDPPCSASAATSSSSSKENRAAEIELSAPDMLFVDYAYVYSDRLKKLKSQRALVNDPEAVFKALRTGISRTFNLVYTKMWRSTVRGLTMTPDNHLSMFLYEITMTLPVASIVLFHISHKQAYRGSDVKVTYLLLYITYFSEIISGPVRLVYLSFQRLPRSSWSTFFDRGFCTTCFLMVYAWLLNIVGLPSFSFICVQQQSLIRSVVDKKRWWFIACIPICGEFLQQCWFGRSNFYCNGKDITRMVLTHAEKAWMICIEDVDSYWKLSDSRGHWTLERNECHKCTMYQVLWESLEKPLDESVILWHLATDFCFHCKGTSADPEPAILCTKISNYMMYLLCANTEMLLPGSRTSLFKDACRELDHIIILGEPGAREHLPEKVMSKAASSGKGTVLHDAWLLAQALMQLPPGGGGADGDDGKMWTVIKGVWMEMLCFSAGRCRGYLHAKHLAYGGEFITFVALLMSNAGLETFAERQQRMRPQLAKEERLKRAETRVIIEQATRSNQAAAGEENATTATATATPSSASSKGECPSASGQAGEVVILLN